MTYFSVFNEPVVEDNDDSDCDGDAVKMLVEMRYNGIMETFLLNYTFRRCYQYNSNFYTIVFKIKKNI